MNGEKQMLMASAKMILVLDESIRKGKSHPGESVSLGIKEKNETFSRQPTEEQGKAETSKQVTREWCT